MNSLKISLCCFNCCIDAFQFNLKGLDSSKYEYVKSFEVEDRLMPCTWIIVRIDGHDFQRFSQVHEFMKPNDEQALNLMNSCAMAVLEEYPDIIYSYGFSDEYSFILKKTSNFYQRRASKIVSIIVSFFSSLYVMKWKEFFPQKEMRFLPSFHGQIFCCPSAEVFKDYLVWRREECHINNQYDTCYWMLVQSGRTEGEAQSILKGSQKQDRNELLFQQFGVNYDKLPIMFRRGSCVLKEKVEEIVKFNHAGDPVRRLRKKLIVDHFDPDWPSFWIKHPSLIDELHIPMEDFCNIWSTKCDYVKSFEVEYKLMPCTWIVVRIDGCHFHRFSEIHEFEKPNDEQALNLMNSCAVAMLEEFPDVVFSYGVSDEYSFVLKERSQFCQRRARKIVSQTVSFFSSLYVMKWKLFFPGEGLKYPPSFDGRTVCYPSVQILRDYLSWRQIDCHINNQYNTCFWMLVKSGKTKSEAQYLLKGTQTQEKNKLLLQQFGINYERLPVMFRRGSCVYRDKVTVYPAN
ncbi:tRNA(His) guanylyltransferase 1-like isoform X1 [Macadamia integrifolia]|uniref:tRNA(His) guanylyltransferase 1-like isoform X1 n=3 Tax=Macadamia integrifolia TaxID=60698 RepID=UPI001C532ACD|nr:tRNA(His) guanylyltransferase 1-like isoform X1 [Macadamia integrifolia]XP_042520636.1 tRNA(His) guanylyltransferase 1-like isoform X1 [Macadamia integrifolia]